MLGLTSLYGDQKPTAHCIDYAYTELTSPAEQAVQMRFSSDDDATVRLNGKEVFRFEGSGGVDYDKHIVPITLPAGKSRLEVKVHNRAGMWGFYMRFTDLDGNPLKGLEFSPATAK